MRAGRGTSTVYRTRSQAVGLGLFLLFVTVLLVSSGARSKLSVAALVAEDAVWALLMIPAARAALARLVADEHGVTVRNPFRTVRIEWNEITGFELGRYKLLGCVCLIQRQDRAAVPVFAIEGITGQPRRKTSLQAQTWIDELNARLQQEQARLAGSALTGET